MNVETLTDKTADNRQAQAMSSKTRPLRRGACPSLLLVAVMVTVALAAAFTAVPAQAFTRGCPEGNGTQQQTFLPRSVKNITCRTARIVLKKASVSRDVRLQLSGWRCKLEGSTEVRCARRNQAVRIDIPECPTVAFMPTDVGEDAEATIDLTRKITCGDAVKIAERTKVFLSGKTHPPKGWRCRYQTAPGFVIDVSFFGCTHGPKRFRVVIVLSTEDPRTGPRR